MLLFDIGNKTLVKKFEIEQEYVINYCKQYIQITEQVYTARSLSNFLNSFFKGNFHFQIQFVIVKSEDAV